MGNTPMQKPDSFLVWAILSTFMCCMPLGIVAIIKATQVDSYWAQGLHEEAYKAAAEAKKWTLIGAGLAAALVFYIFLL